MASLINVDQLFMGLRNSRHPNRIADFTEQLIIAHNRCQRRKHACVCRSYLGWLFFHRKLCVNALRIFAEGFSS